MSEVHLLFSCGRRLVSAHKTAAGAAEAKDVAERKDRELDWPAVDYYVYSIKVGS